jgi:hypothetical protein
MHVDGERGRRGMIGEAGLLSQNLRGGKAPAAQLFWNHKRQVTRLPKVVEIFVEEAVVAIIVRSPDPESCQQLVAEQGLLLGPIRRGICLAIGAPQDLVH